MSRRKAFSLIELLVAMSLGLIILGVIAFAFHHASMASTRSLALLNLNNKAQAISTLIERDLSSVNNLGAISASTTELTIMVNLQSVDFDLDGYDSTKDYAHEMAWVKYDFIADATTADPDDYVVRRGWIAPPVGAAAGAIPSQSAVSTPGAMAAIMTGVYKVGGTADFITPDVPGANIAGFSTDGTGGAGRPTKVTLSYELRSKGERGAEFKRNFTFSCALP